ncbi:acyltransferase [Lachnospiraceae bacterium OttesenSCG-928-D06]|nr:acyltransferase [Lachnospiraceae bacterium OttesenSCG-928-D06]
MEQTHSQKNTFVNSDTQGDFHKLHFDSIQTLRGIAAIFVVFEHIRFLQNGAFGVDLFFCISGFMIMFTTYKDTKHFLRKRLLRILPFYYAMTIATYFLLLVFPSMFEQSSANLSYLAKSLLFIPFDIGNGAIQPLLRIGWTINMEMFFYLLFFLASHISHKYRGLLCSLFLGAFVLLGKVFLGANVVLSFYSNPIILEFVMGMLCYEIARKIYNYHRKQKGSPFLIPVLSLLSLFLVIFMWQIRPLVSMSGFNRLLYWGIPALLILLCFFTLGLLTTMPKFTVTLGNISFSLYLIHYYPVMFIDRKILDFSIVTPISVLGAICSILIIILAAKFAWYLIEHKLGTWLRVQLKV